ncbi:MAG: beta strand repeat-containing protein [Phycisphaerae bacterium]
MAKVRHLPVGSVSHPAFESLEERLLLTTVHGGETFVYRNQFGNLVTVALNGAPTDAIELFGYDNLTADITNGGNFPGLVDLVGLMNGDPADQVRWPDGLDIYDNTTPPGQWVDQNATPTGTNSPRGSRTEIYAIYVASASPTTTLSITSTGGTTNVPLLDPALPAPANSGEVIIGAKFSGTPTTPDHLGVSQTDDMVLGAPAIGVYPGGDLNAGITVAASVAYTLVTSAGGTGVGSDVQAVATDSTGAAWSVDQTAFQGQIVTDGSPAGLGANIGALAANAAGNMFSVENGPTYTLFAPLLGNNVMAMAADPAAPNNFYYVDEATHTLRMTTPNGAVTTIGTLLDTAQAQFRYDLVQALAFNPTDGSLNAIGSITDLDLIGPPPAPNPNGPFLMAIDKATGLVTRGALITGAGIDNTTQFSAMAYAPNGTLYALISGTDELVTINGAGAATLVGVVMSGGVARDITGLAFIYKPGDANGTLYGVTDSGLYRINTGTAAAVAMPVASVTGMTDLTYDVSRPGYLFASMNSGGATKMARLAMGASLVSVNDSTGVPTWVGGLRDAAEPTYVFSNITAMDFSGATLYAVGTVTDLNLNDAPNASGVYLFRINTATGVATRVGPVTGAANLTGIAFSGGTLYGVYDANTTLYTVNTATGAATAAASGLPGYFEGIQSVTVGANSVLYGVTKSSLYVIDTGTPSNSKLLGNTGRIDLSALAFDTTKPGALWSASVDSGAWRLVRIGMSATLVKTTSAGVVTRPFQLFSASNPAVAYSEVHALAYDSGGTLYGVAVPVSRDPLHATVVGSPLHLVTIDTSTGLVTYIGTFGAGVSDITGLAFDRAGVLYGVNATTNELTQIDASTAALGAAVALDTAGITGLTFVLGPPDTLYAITSTTLYTVDPATGTCTAVKTVGATGMKGLSNIPGSLTDLYAIAPFSGADQLIDIAAGAGSGNFDMGTVIIDGTLAGTFQNPGGGLTAITMGFLWGKIDVAGSIQYVTMNFGGGGLASGGAGGSAINTPLLSTSGDPDSWIRAGGYITGISSLSGTLYSFIDVGHNTALPLPSDTIDEQLLRHDSRATAQPVSHPTGNFTINGTLAATQGSTFTFLSYKTQRTAGASISDWYSMPLMGGQTVTIDGYSGADPLTDRNVDIAVHLYDSAGHFMGSLGYETVQDIGIGSRGATQKPMRFTAPAADIYYIVVFRPTPRAGDNADYSLTVTGGTAADLGVVNVVGNYVGSVRTTMSTYDPNYPLETPSMQMLNGGTIGAILVSGSTDDNVVRAYGASASSPGRIYVYQAGTIGANAMDGIVSDGDIGRVATTTGTLFAEIWAGGSGFYDSNASLQNVVVATDVLAGSWIASTGSIGVIEVGGVLGGATIWVNDDGVGLPGHVDLIDVKRDWGSLTPGVGVPLLYHGPGGDIGYVHVGGNIYTNIGGWVSPAQPTTYSDGRTTILNDDGGGQLTVTPVPTTTMVNFQPVTWYPTYSFTYIGVDDAYFPGSGVGGVIANLTINGSATLTANGTVQISDLFLNGQTTRPTSLTIVGSGRADVYYVHSNKPIASFVNNTPGNLVSGTFGGKLDNIQLNGSIGALTGSTGAWLYGYNTAPTSTNIRTQPQYGWFHGTVNGLMVNGALGTLSVGGSLGDLRVMGTIGSIVVNSDHFTPFGGWDGVTGLVWSSGRMTSINVGDGLADDGGTDKARAAIMCTRSIGTVSVNGPRYLLGGQVYHQLDGSILAHSNDVIRVQQPDGTFINVAVDAIGQVTGTGGAWLSAIVGALDLNAFQVYLTGVVTSVGSIGTVSFSGPGAQITGSQIEGNWIGTVMTSNDSDWMVDTVIAGNSGMPNSNVIGQVLAGGQGMKNVRVSANGGNIGTIAATSGAGDIIDSVFQGSDSLGSARARNIRSSTAGASTDFHFPGSVGSITATGNINHSMALVGSLGTLSVGGGFANADYRIAGVLGSMTVGASFLSSSRLIIQGSAGGFLKSLTVKGNLDGQVQSAARIGSVVVGGRITGDISTTGTGSNSDVDLIQTGGGYLGTMDIGGSLKSFVSSATLGLAPGAGQTFYIHNNLNSLTVKSSASSPGDLNANFSVGGSIGTMDIAGVLYGIVGANGDLTSLTARGGLGGVVGGTTYGELRIRGDIGSLTIPAGRNLVSDLSVGGNLSSLTLSGGSILGDVESRGGKIGAISVTSGNISGNLTAARGIDSISVKGGNITGNITLTGGSLKSLTLDKGGLPAVQLGGNIDVQNGTIDLLSLVGANTMASKTISASAGIGSITVSGANLASNVVSRRGITSLSVANGEIDGTVWAETDIGTLSAAGVIRGTTVRSGGTIGSIKVAGLAGATISSARDIASIAIGGQVTGSKVLAGLDVGPNKVLGGGDDVLAAGSIGNITVGGGFINSFLMAGVSAGPDGRPKTTADNQLAAGVSTIGGSIAAFNANSAVLAETSVSAAIRTAALAAGAMVFEGFPTGVIVPGPTSFGPLSGNTTLAVGGLTLSLTGAGIASYNSTTGVLRFEQTTSSSNLTVSYTTGLAYGQVVTIWGGDDSPLGTLSVTSNVTVGAMLCDGSVKTLTVPTVAAGAVWNLPGGVGTAAVASPQDVRVNAGAVTSWTMGSAYKGAFKAGAVGTFNLTGDLMGAGNINAFSINSATIRGNLVGKIQSWTTIGSLNVTGGLNPNASLNVITGDLGTLTVGGGLTGSVNVGRQTVAGVTYGGGRVNSATIGGNFGGQPNSSFRAALGIVSFTTRGNFYGLLSTEGDLPTLTVAGVMGGRLWAGGSINKVTLGSMWNGLIAASGDILTTTMPGSMTTSYILAGFNPGDAGFDPLHGNEAANLMLDALTPAPWRTPANQDQVFGGHITTVTIGSSMDRSTIAAGMSPGTDGYLGTPDDVVGDAGFITRVTVQGMIAGDYTSASYGIYASSNLPVVTQMGGQAFSANGNIRVGTAMGTLPF